MSVRSDESAAFLLARHVVTPEQLADACLVSQQQCVPVEDALILLGYASAGAIAAARAAWLGLPFLDLSGLMVRQHIVEMLPESVARENLALPVACDRDSLTVALPDLRRTVLEKLEFILNRRVWPVLAAPEQLAEAIDRHYGQSETESVDSMLAEFTDTAIDFTQTEGPTSPFGSPPARDQRTVSSNLSWMRATAASGIRSKPCAPISRSPRSTRPMPRLPREAVPGRTERPGPRSTWPGRAPPSAGLPCATTTA